MGEEHSVTRREEQVSMEKGAKYLRAFPSALALRNVLRFD
jgi:hypothetical protein